MFTSDCLYVYSFHRAEPLIIEHMNSVATTLETDKKLKVPSIQFKLDILNTVDATETFPQNIT